MHTRGWTIWEVLLVGCMLLVVGAMLYPAVVRHSCGGDRSSLCIDNQRQLSLVVLMYAQDTASTAPGKQETLLTAPARGAWTSRLDGYDYSDCDCRSSSFKGTHLTPDYGFNAALYGMPLTRISHPATTLLLTDCAAEKMAGSDYAFTAHPQDARYYGTLIAARHDHYSLYTCVDGHVASLSVPPDVTISAALEAAGVVVNPSGRSEP